MSASNRNTGDGNSPVNILLITTDQQRFDAVGYMNQNIKTPNIDRLAENGVAFTNAYTSCAVCTPARVTILTGHYASKHGCYQIGTHLPEDYKTIPMVFNEGNL